MKKYILFWLIFFALFFGIVAVTYYLRIDADIVVALLLILYFVFQGIALYQARKQKDSKWIISSMIVQTLFAVCSPLYYSNFGDPQIEFIGGTWLDSSDALEPCHLCWWARIMMFPLLPLSIIYAYTHQKGILWYVYLVTFPGMALELFHYILQKPAIVGQVIIHNPFGCTAANPCAAVHVDYFGFLTIPLLCFFAFLIIHICVTILLFGKKSEQLGGKK